MLFWDLQRKKYLNYTLYIWLFVPRILTFVLVQFWCSELVSIFTIVKRVEKIGQYHKSIPGIHICDAILTFYRWKKLQLRQFGNSMVILKINLNLLGITKKCLFTKTFHVWPTKRPYLRTSWWNIYQNLIKMFKNKLFENKMKLEWLLFNKDYFTE